LYLDVQIALHCHSLEQAKLARRMLGSVGKIDRFNAWINSPLDTVEIDPDFLHPLTIVTNR
jgi:hypothetical protein